MGREIANGRERETERELSETGQRVKLDPIKTLLALDGKGYTNRSSVIQSFRFHSQHAISPSARAKGKTSLDSLNLHKA